MLTWEDNIKMGLKEQSVSMWTGLKLAEARVQWQSLLFTAKNHRREILDYCLSLNFILILSSNICPCLSSGLFPSDLPTKILYAFLTLSCVLHDLPISSLFISST